MRSAPDTAYQLGIVCHATGPAGVTTLPKFNGRCAALSAAAFLALRSWAKNCGKYAGSM